MNSPKYGSIHAIFLLLENYLLMHKYYHNGRFGYRRLAISPQVWKIVDSNNDRSCKTKYDQICYLPPLHKNAQH